jgi:uncharacterized glyoxalase superfamily protein PhnB
VHGQVHLDVEEVDAHCVHARAAGATIASEPTNEPHGDREYRALDPEGPSLELLDPRARDDP